MDSFGLLVVGSFSFAVCCCFASFVVFSLVCFVCSSFPHLSSSFLLSPSHFTISGNECRFPCFFHVFTYLMVCGVSCVLCIMPSV